MLHFYPISLEFAGPETSGVPLLTHDVNYELEKKGQTVLCTLRLDIDKRDQIKENEADNFKDPNTPVYMQHPSCVGREGE